MLLIRVEYEKAVNARQCDYASRECVCHCAGAATVDNEHGRDTILRLEAEADRWRAIAEEYQSLLVQNGVLRITAAQGKVGGEQALTTAEKLVGEL